MNSFRTRFAPSPTGRLHLGHVFSAIQVRTAADRAGGEALLRLEDTDLGRCRPEFEAGILEDLDWLGLAWDGPVRRQSDHLGDYARVVETLRAKGLVYRCFRTRKDIQAMTDGRPDAPFQSEALPAGEESARLDRGDAFAWRLSLHRALEHLGSAVEPLRFGVETEEKMVWVQAEPERFGDIALTRKDSPAAYHLAACHDDALQGITHVIRGEDLIDAPHIHTVLQALMGWPTPLYRHHRLLLGPDGKRLSKRDGSMAIAALRDAGYGQDAVRKMAGAA
ncbi:MAG: tRNA glutamyl-Q(34) synthetase GluQRS [Pseudomonadota bacterium]